MERAAAPQPRDQRDAERFDTSVPVTIEGSVGQTQNISTQGVYFETDVEPRPGAPVNFTLEFSLHGRKHRVLCEGQVVRVDRKGERFGVAARLLTPLFEGAEEVQVV